MNPGARMSMRGGGGGNPMRSFRRDRSVLQQRLPKGLVRRILRFAAPYRRVLGVYLVLIVIDAAVGAANPLIYRAIIDQGILRHRTGIVVALALVVAGLALLDTGLSLWQRWISARVGEGLIYDMRSKVFAHLQQMPIAFFVRTQTGAMVSRLNSDVLDAQSAFTDTASSLVSNAITVVVMLAAMFFLSWQITLVALALLPVLVVPARWVGKRIQGITRESYNLNAQMTTIMTERFNVSGALLVKLFGQPEREVAAFSERAGRVRDIGVLQAMSTRVFMVSLLLTASLATALAYGWGGVEAAAGYDRPSAPDLPRGHYGRPATTWTRIPAPLPPARDPPPRRPPACQLRGPRRGSLPCPAPATAPRARPAPAPRTAHLQEISGRYCAAGSIWAPSCLPC